MEELPLPKVYQLIELGPAVLLTTAAKWRFNVMTMSRHMMADFNSRFPLPIRDLK